MANVTISGLRKSFGKTRALDGIDLSVPTGEFCAVVGPPGCGKTTLLRLIAGLDAAEAGRVALDGEAVDDLQPRDRHVALVAQEPVLFPHLTAFENVAFGLRARGTARAEVTRRVEHIAERLGLSGVLRRKPHQLRDGERRRVAIAHAIVSDAMLFLLDEPLAGLSATRRADMRVSLRRLQRERSVTVIYATQDPVEAMIMASRVVVLRKGRIEQVGAPMELYERPASRFVARFFGPLKMNFLTGTVARDGPDASVRLARGEIQAPMPPNILPASVSEGTRVILGVRPEHITRAVRVSPPDGSLRFEADVELLQPTGSRVGATFRLGGEPVVAELQAHDVSATGETVSLDINLKRASLFDAGTGKALSLEGGDRPPAEDADEAASEEEPAA